MTKERGLLESAIEYLYDLQGAWLWKENEVAGNGEEYNDLDNLVVKIREHLSQPEQNKPEVIMPNGVCVSNVYDAYEEGRKSVIVEQEPLLAETKIEWYGKGFRQGVNEFAPPNPLTGDAIYALDKEGIVENMGDHQVRYVLGWIRSVEKAHGIGGGE